MVFVVIFFIYKKNKVKILNIKIVFAYDGSKFFGSQKQKNKKAVANEFIRVLKKLNISSTFILSGRTDKGVHATRQVANIKLPAFWSDLNSLFVSMCRMLPPYIDIKTIKKVDDTFHSRYHATKRVYRYIVKKTKPNVFENAYTHFEPNLDTKAVSKAIKQFEGVFDFGYFCKKPTNKTTREIYEAKFYKYKDYYIFKFVGRSFLRGQVRSMVQFLFDISSQKRNINELKASLNKTIKLPLKVCPPNGLYLMKVIY